MDCPLVRRVVCGLSFSQEGGVWTVLWVGWWCVDCPLVRSVVCGLSFSQEGGVWTVLWVGGWCVDCPLVRRVVRHTGDLWFSLVIQVSSKDLTDCQDITKILLKVT